MVEQTHEQRDGQRTQRTITRMSAVDRNLLDTALDTHLTETGLIENSHRSWSEALVTRVHDGDGEHYILRVQLGGPSSAGLYGEFTSDAVHLPTLYNITTQHICGQRVTIEQFEFVTGRSWYHDITPEEMGKTAAAIERATHNANPRTFTRFGRLGDLSDIPGREHDTLRHLEQLAVDGWEHWTQLSTGYGWSHRDLHPGNIIITDEGAVTLIDLSGVAWGPLGLDVAEIAIGVRRAALGATWVQRALGAYTQHGGQLDTGAVTEVLEPALAAAGGAETLLRALRTTPHNPAHLSEARTRVASALGHTDTPWTYIADLPCDRVP